MEALEQAVEHVGDGGDQLRDVDGGRGFIATVRGDDPVGTVWGGNGGCRHDSEQ